MNAHAIAEATTVVGLVADAINALVRGCSLENRSVRSALEMAYSALQGLLGLGNGPDVPDMSDYQSDRGLPPGYDTVLGYLSKHQSAVLEMMKEPVGDTALDDRCSNSST